METFSALLAFCAGNSPVSGEFPSQRPVTRSFDVFFVLYLDKWQSKKRDAGDLRRHRAHYDVTVMEVKPGSVCADIVPALRYDTNMSKITGNFFTSIFITELHKIGNIPRK